MPFVMQTTAPRRGLVTPRNAVAAVLLTAMAGCTNVSLPIVGTDTGNAPQPQVATAPPVADSRGVISYPTYQAVRVRQGDTVTSIATRLGIDAEELARRNGLPDNATLREGELLLLPQRVATEDDGDDLAALASSALDRSGDSATTSNTASSTSSSSAANAGAEPVRHTVSRGETAYSIARLYNVSVRSLADWNGLPGDYTVREGQVLLIPLTSGGSSASAQADVSPPGAGSTSPQPPSSTVPQPAEDLPAAAEAAPVSVTPLASPTTSASDTARLAKPVEGSIIRTYEKGKNDGLVFGASAGSTVRAADGGTVAAITRDVNQVPIIVVRHADNLLTVYANVDAIAVAKGDTVQRGQKIAVVRDGDPAFLHFEVRDGFESVDPVDYF